MAGRRKVPGEVWPAAGLTVLAAAVTAAGVGISSTTVTEPLDSGELASSSQPITPVLVDQQRLARHYSWQVLRNDASPYSLWPMSKGTSRLLRNPPRSLETYGIPPTARAAYLHASRALSPVCHIPWTFIAAIGKVESDHGGTSLRRNGDVYPAVVGIPLNGRKKTKQIPDTDHGVLDGNKKWDHAVGPMQFIPSTWRQFASDGNADGVDDVNNIYDASVAAGKYLCRTSPYLDATTTMTLAARSYNNDAYYAALVVAYEVGYRTGVFHFPEPPWKKKQRLRREKLERQRKQRLARIRAAQERAAARQRAAERKAAQKQAEKAKKTKASASPSPSPSTQPSSKPSKGATAPGNG